MRGKEIESHRFGISNDPLTNNSGYHREVLTYDARGNLTKEEWWGAPGTNRVINKDAGAFRRERMYNARGDVTDTRLFGTDENPVNGKEGWARETVEYDEQTGAEKKRIRYRADGSIAPGAESS